MKTINVEYLLSDNEVKRLEALATYYQNYKNPEGDYPFREWEIEDVFQAIMTVGCVFDISDRLEFAERRQKAELEAEAIS